MTSSCCQTSSMPLFPVRSALFFGGPSSPIASQLPKNRNPRSAGAQGRLPSFAEHRLSSRSQASQFSLCHCPRLRRDQVTQTVRSIVAAKHTPQPEEGPAALDRESASVVL